MSAQTTNPPTYKLNLRLLGLAVAGVVLLLMATLQRLEIDADITNALPSSDPVIDDARQMLAILPKAGQVLVDLQLAPHDAQQLRSYGDIVARRMTASGLFEQVGISGYRTVYPALVKRVLGQLPYLFNPRQLQENVAPLLTTGSIENRLGATLQNFQGLDGVGLAALVPKDPMRWHELVLARLQPMAPAAGVKAVDNFLLSADRRHLLIIATPRNSATDTRNAKAIAGLMDQIIADLKARMPSDQSFTLTAMGAYRAALDNETMARADTRRAVMLATLGIAALFLLSFRRPWLGLLALVPAIAGTVAALFTLSLFRPRLSLMAIGFGGAVISITVDHAIAFLLFLDRTESPTTGAAAARQVWAVGLIAALTTVVAFFSLTFSGFDLLAQIGQFAALGIGFAFLFVHSVFKPIFQSVPPARKTTTPPMAALADRLALPGKPLKAGLALAFSLLMLIWARPHFDIDLNSMNALSSDTRAAEVMIRDTWGDMGNHIYLHLSAPTLRELRENSDRLASSFEHLLKNGVLSQALSMTDLFPGATLARSNADAWRHFWNPDRLRKFKEHFARAAEKTGFAPTALSPFVDMIENPPPRDASLPPLFFDLLQVTPPADGGEWAAVATLTPGSAYDPGRFRQEVNVIAGVRIFDAKYFSARLGALIARTFTRMAAIVAAAAFLMLMLYFRSPVQALIAMAPLAAALVCTLGTMGIFQRPMDIPGLMLAIVVMGMGIDYALYLVRSYQHFADEHSPGSQVVRLTILLAACSTLLGFGSMCFADHVVLKSAGLTTTGAIFYALIMTFAIVPFLQTKLIDANDRRKSKIKKTGTSNIEGPTPNVES